MSTPPTLTQAHRVTTPDGWRLNVQRATRGGRPVDGPPVLFVPGYGMNSHIFHHHPGDQTFAEVLMDAGLDPWSVDLRGTSTALAPSRRAIPRLADQAFIDLPGVFDHIAAATGAERVNAIGCSLGGLMLYAHAGRDDHRIDRLVTMGSPLVMTADTFPLRTFGRLGPALARIPVKGTRRIARAALPIVRRAAPGLLWFYMNPDLIDLSDPEVLVGTIEDPSPDISAGLSRWIREGSLVLAGHDVTRGLAAYDRPLMVVYADDDGVCPPRAALTAVDAASGPVEVMRVSHADGPVRHADLFVAHFTPTEVFPPVAAFLKS